MGSDRLTRKGWLCFLSCMNIFCVLSATHSSTGPAVLGMPCLTSPTRNWSATYWYWPLGLQLLVCIEVRTDDYEQAGELLRSTNFTGRPIDFWFQRKTNSQRENVLTKFVLDPYLIVRFSRRARRSPQNVLKIVSKNVLKTVMFIFGPRALPTWLLSSRLTQWARIASYEPVVSVSGEPGPLHMMR